MWSRSPDSSNPSKGTIGDDFEREDARASVTKSLATGSLPPSQDRSSVVRQDSAGYDESTEEHLFTQTRVGRADPGISAINSTGPTVLTFEEFCSEVYPVQVMPIDASDSTRGDAYRLIAVA